MKLVLAKKLRNWGKFFMVLYCITIVGIPVGILSKRLFYAIAEILESNARIENHFGIYIEPNVEVAADNPVAVKAQSVTQSSPKQAETQVSILNQTVANLPLADRCWQKAKTVILNSGLHYKCPARNEFSDLFSQASLHQIAPVYLDSLQSYLYYKVEGALQADGVTLSENELFALKTCIANLFK